jgi:hypothetical protein
MKKVVATLVAVAFGATLLSAPTVALSVPGNTCNPASGHGRSGCHRVTTPAPVTEVSVPGTATVTSRPAGPSKVKVRKTLALAGTVSAPESAGTVTVVKTRLVGGKWKNAGSVTIPLINGTYSYRFKPTKKGSWRFVAKYSGTWDGSAGYAASKSGAKTVKVK